MSDHDNRNARQSLINKIQKKLESISKLETVFRDVLRQNTNAYSDVYDFFENTNFFDLFYRIQNLEGQDYSLIELYELNNIYRAIEEIEDDIQKLIDAIQSGEKYTIIVKKSALLDSKINRLKDSVSNKIFLRLSLSEKEKEQEKEKTEQELNKTQNESADTSTDDASSFFENNGNSYKKTANRWLRILISLTLTTFIASLAFLYFAFIDFPYIIAENHYQFIRVSATSLFFITFLFTSTIWSARMYKSNLHLHTINQHKSISLNIVNTLRAGGMTPEAKDVIVTEAAKAIFTDPQTGLIKNKSDNSSTSLTISDLVKLPPSS